MREVETEFRPNGIQDDVPFFHYAIKVYKSVVGLMRMYEDMEQVIDWQEEYMVLLENSRQNFKDFVTVPKAEGKVSVRPYVRGRPRKRNKCAENYLAQSESNPAPIEPLAQPSEAPELKQWVDGHEGSGQE